MSKESALIQQTVVCTLRMLGIDSGLVSYNKAQKLYGKPFREMVRRGEISPVSVGDGTNGTKTYSIMDIISRL